MASRISASVGSGFFSRKAVAVRIMPGVQNPHCRPCSTWNPSCIGVSSVPLQMPSMVVTSCPFARTASTVHDLTGYPSSCTVHAPQLDVSLSLQDLFRAAGPERLAADGAHPDAGVPDLPVAHVEGDADGRRSVVAGPAFDLGV